MENGGSNIGGDDVVIRDVSADGEQYQEDDVIVPVKKQPVDDVTIAADDWTPASLDAIPVDESLVNGARDVAEREVDLVREQEDVAETGDVTTGNGLAEDQRCFEAAVPEAETAAAADETVGEATEFTEAASISHELQSPEGDGVASATDDDIQIPQQPSTAEYLQEDAAAVPSPATGSSSYDFVKCSFQWSEEQHEVGERVPLPAADIPLESPEPIANPTDPLPPQETVAPSELPSSSPAPSPSTLERQPEPEEAVLSAHSQAAPQPSADDAVPLTQWGQHCWVKEQQEEEQQDATSEERSSAPVEMLRSPSPLGTTVPSGNDFPVETEAAAVGSPEDDVDQSRTFGTVSDAGRSELVSRVDDDVTTDRLQSDWKTGEEQHQQQQQQQQQNWSEDDELRASAGERRQGDSSGPVVQRHPILAPLTIQTRSSAAEQTPPSSGSGSDGATAYLQPLDGSGISPSSLSPGQLQPVNRQPVEKVAPPEITKNVRRMFESGELPDRHEVRRTPLPTEEPLPVESGVFENEPVQNEGVVRGGDNVPGDEVQRGLTKSLLSQWQTKGSEQFRTDRPPINIAEAEGRVAENEPVRRPDVVREDDTDYLAGLPSRGQAKLLRQQWTAKGDAAAAAGPAKDAKAQFLADVAAAEAAERSAVLENEPVRRSDVLREDDNLEEVWLRKGYTRDLAGFWSAPRDAANTGSDTPRRPIELPRGDGAESAVVENEPKRLDGVVRADDPAGDESIAAVEKGRARTMVGLWQNRQTEQPKVREPFRLDMDVSTSDAGVFENAPVALEGVVRSTDAVDEVMGQRGLIRNIAERFQRPDAADQQQRPRGPPRDMIVIDRADGPAVLENEPAPVRADVVRSDPGSFIDVPPVERGTTRNLVACWKNKELEQTSPQLSGDKPSARVLDLAPEAGVYENQPEVRDDVVRADEYEPEVIPVARTRSTRAMWSRREAETDDTDSRKAPPALVRFTPPREVTPPRLHQDDFRSFQTLTLSPSSASSTSPRSASPGAAIVSPQAKQQHQLANEKTMTSSTTLILKSN
jgi:hypothetical protein